MNLSDTLNRVGIDIPKIEVRYEHLSIEGDAYVGSRALPSLLNSTLNVIEVSEIFLRAHFESYIIKIFFHTVGSFQT